MITTTGNESIKESNWSINKGTSLLSKESLPTQQMRIYGTEEVLLELSQVRADLRLTKNLENGSKSMVLFIQGHVLRQVEVK